MWYNTIFLKKASTMENPSASSLLIDWGCLLNHASIIALTMNGLPHFDPTFHRLVHVLYIWKQLKTFKALVFVWQNISTQGPLTVLAFSRDFPPVSLSSSADGVSAENNHRQTAAEDHSSGGSLNSRVTLDIRPSVITWLKFQTSDFITTEETVRCGRKLQKKAVNGSWFKINLPNVCLQGRGLVTC